MGGAAFSFKTSYLIVVPSAVGKSAPMGRDTAEDWKWGVESVCSLTETAEENGVTLVIEPLNRLDMCQYLFGEVETVKCEARHAARREEVKSGTVRNLEPSRFIC